MNLFRTCWTHNTHRTMNDVRHMSNMAKFLFFWFLREICLLAFGGTQPTTMTLWFEGFSEDSKQKNVLNWRKQLDGNVELLRIRIMDGINQGTDKEWERKSAQNEKELLIYANRKWYLNKRFPIKRNELAHENHSEFALSFTSNEWTEHRR